jgi:hypothetical protein
MKETIMSKLRNALLGIAIVGSLAGVIPTAGSAAPVATEAERSACTSDAFRMCLAAIPNQTAVIACLKSKKSQLSPTCKQLFDRI